MKRSIFLIMLPGILMLGLLAAFILVSPVYAQDETPPPEVSPEETLEAEDEIPVEGAGTEIPADPAGTDPAGTTEELAPVLESAAETGVTLADEGGEPLPLAEEETAEILAGGDPWYKVGAVTYHFMFPGDCAIYYPGDLNCFESSTPIQDAIDYIPTTGLPSDGMIYVEAEAYTEYVTVPGYGDPLYGNLKGLIGTVGWFPQVNLTGDIWIQYVDLGFSDNWFQHHRKYRRSLCRYQHR